jgi:hypothetical protein
MFGGTRGTWWTCSDEAFLICRHRRSYIDKYLVRSYSKTVSVDISPPQTAYRELIQKQ